MCHALMCKTSHMTEPYMTNGLLLAFTDLLYNDRADADAAEVTFHSTDGTFLQRITAAVNALLLPHLKPERFIVIPETPEDMTREALDALVRPVAEGFLRSHPSKDELLAQLHQIARRQETRPSWMPRTEDSPSADIDDEDADNSCQPVPVSLSGFPELGEVTIKAPAFYGDPMYEAESNESALLQMALLTVFGATTPSAPGQTVRGDSAALDALVAAEDRWWAPPEAAETPKTAATDPGTAVEVLATTQSIGGVTVQDMEDLDASDAATDVLRSTGSWKHGPRIVVDGWRPTDDSRVRSLARASFAGWAGETDQGFVAVIASSGWDEDADKYPLGHRLHSFILWWAAPQVSVAQDPGTLNRVVLYCPGEDVCPRGGCRVTLDDELLAAFGLVVTDADVTASIAANADWAAEAHRASLLGTVDDDPDEVLSVAVQPLLEAGWEEISNSSSELGDVEVLLSRREQVLAVAYRPLTREVTLADGRSELDFLCEILADDGCLTEGPEGIRRVNRAAAAETWSDSALSLIERYLRNDLADNPELINPVNILLAGIWPWGTGVPATDEDRSLVQRQVMLSLSATALLGS
jgi:hypothetical protein